jgi:predicted  nucleic acid-binding Zn-ribbon protein
MVLTHTVRKSELRNSVETYESQIDELRKQVQAAEEASKSARSTLETTRKELDRALPFEKEVREKNLLIGKLRHEAVTLNEHLTKALRILKKGRPEDNVDRQIITNYFLHFLAIDRSDPKKFEALQLIAALLGWTDGMPYDQHATF